MTAAPLAAPAGGAPAALGALEQAVSWLEGFPEWLNTTLDDIRSTVNAVLDAVPGLLQDAISWIVDQARALWERIVSLAKQLLAWLQEYVWPVIRGPWTLWEAGNQWTTSVYRQVSDVSGQLDLSKTSVEDYWTGHAATAYTQAIGAQKAAADLVTTAIEATREALQSLALTLGSLYVALVAGLALAAIEIAGGSVAVATVLGIPPGLVAVVTGLLTAIGTVAAIYGGGKELLSGSAEKFATLLQLRNDSSAFNHGHWPVASAATNLADASMTDGTESNWLYKR